MQLPIGANYYVVRMGKHCLSRTRHTGSAERSRKDWYDVRAQSPSRMWSFNRFVALALLVLPCVRGVQRRMLTSRRCVVTTRSLSAPCARLEDCCSID